MKNIIELPKISYYDFYFNVEPQNGNINVQGLLSIENETSRSFNTLPILLYNQLKVKNIKNKNNKNLDFKQEVVSLIDEQKLYVNYILIKLENNLKQDDQINLYIEYEGSINGYSHIMVYVKDKIEKDFSIIRPDCLAYPIISRPSYESISKSYENTFNYNLFIEVPKDYVVACGGILRDIINKNGRNVFNYVSDLSTWRFDIGVAKYSIIEDKEMNLKIFVFHEHKDNAEKVVKKEVKRIYDYFATVFGRYSKDNYYSIIEVKESYGSQAGDNYITMEEHGFIGDSKDINHLYHEIGHWWNVKARYDIQQTRFFDEAFASYFEALGIREFYGDEAYRDKMNLYREYFIESVKDNKINYNTPICNYGEFGIGHNSYTKGPWALYILNEIVGNEIFYKIIRTFLDRFKDKEVDFTDFEEVAQEVSGVNLAKYFKQWIYGIESSKFLCERIDISDIISSI